MAYHSCLGSYPTEDWSVRELQRQRNSAFFERVAVSKNKEEVLELANKGQEVAHYRLKQTDFDRGISDSNTSTVNMGDPF